MAKREETFDVADESGDRKYFTIVPNYILNHSTLYDREVYIQMKRIAGEGGRCWASRTTLAKRCGMSVRKLDASLKYLLEHDWIRKVGTRKVAGQEGGLQMVYEYQVVDIWKKNVSFYEQGGAGGALPLAKGVQEVHQGGAGGAHKEEPVLIRKSETEFRVVPEDDQRTPDRLPKKTRDAYLAMIKWAEQQRGFPFRENGKQMKALALGKKYGLKAEQLKEKWIEFEGQPFWVEKGFDWMNVVKSFENIAI